MRQLVAAVARQKGLDRTIFELQARDWRVGKPIDTEILRRQMVQLRSLGAINYGYYRTISSPTTLTPKRCAM